MIESRMSQHLMQKYFSCYKINDVLLLICTGRLMLCIHNLSNYKLFINFVKIES